MGISKTEKFTKEQNHLAKMTKALGHPARIAILEVLMQKRSCICGDIVDVLPLSQSTVSQHLKALKEAGIIVGEIDGPRTCYCIDSKVWKDLQQLVQFFFNQWKDPTCC